MITVLAMGQSNAVGRNTGGREAFSSALTCWNNENDIDSGTTNIGTAFVAADVSTRPFTDNCNNMLIQACNLLARASGEDVRVILVAMGGKRIDSWATSTGTTGAMYTRTRNVLAAAGVTAVDLVLWHQGESDDNAGTTGTYAASWGHLLDNLESHGHITATTPIVMGLTAKDFLDINPVLVSIAASDSRVGLAKISGFATDDDVHFLGEEAINIGMEYLRALNEIPGSDFEGVIDAADLTGYHAIISNPSAEYKRATLPGFFDSRRGQSFQALKQEDQTSIASATYTKVTFPLELWDVNSKYDPSLSRYTPGSGVHRISASIQLSGITADTVQLAMIYKNGTEWARSQVRPTGSTVSINVSRLDWCNDLDYYEVYVYLTTGSSGTVSAISSESWFESQQL